MSPQPGAFRLAASSNGELHLVSDLPQRVTISKVLWDALAAGAHPHARIETPRFPGFAPYETVQLDLVIETAECTFRYRREEWDEIHDHYLCALVSRQDVPPPLEIVPDRIRGGDLTDYTDPAAALRKPQCTCGYTDPIQDHSDDCPRRTN